MFKLFPNCSNVLLTSSFSFIICCANQAVAFETSFSCKGKKGVKIAELNISISGTEDDVVEKNEIPATAKFSLAKFGKTTEKNIKLVGRAQNSAKGIYYELRPASGEKSVIKEIFISAPASNSESTITEVSDKEHSLDCQ